MNQMKFDLAGVQEVIETFEESRKNISIIFDAIRFNSNLMNDENNWQGPTHDVVVDKQKLFEQNFDPIIEALDVYINFLKTTALNYENQDMSVIKNVDSNSENMDVNS